MAEEEKYNSSLDVDDELINEIHQLISSKSDAILKQILADLYNYDISVLINNLKETEDAIYLFKLLPDETASEVILELDDARREQIVSSLDSEEISDIVGEMYSDDAADFVSDLTDDIKEEVLQELEKDDKEDSDEIRELLTYDENTAGGIMAKEFIALNENLTVEEAINQIQEKAEEVDQFYNVWVVNDKNELIGIISLKRIIIALKNPKQLLKDVKNPDVISVEANVDQEEVARIMQRYDLVSLPVVDNKHRVIGKISIDDIVDVMEEEYSEDFAKMTGTDAEELEKKSPFQIAKLRLPWILITMGIELIAVFVIKSHNEILEKVILLAAFMPIISAISGNTGLQSAAIVVRAIDTGLVNINKWWIPLIRQIKTTLIIGFVVGVIIAIIGYIMMDTNKTAFALSVGISMFISINIAGIVGTTTPMISKKLGFDPAVTSGPFETAFQDVVGISIFLTISTFLLSHIIN
ncbi:MAG TPA: magnesium transporter [Ignavibacteria bacterium]|nr:magnesium transporter [Ignavibacteria bacterium]